jgi:hypothetical protein
VIDGSSAFDALLVIAEMTGWSRRGLMGDSLAMLDRSVGRLMNLTADLEIDENTLMIFSADNVSIAGIHKNFK